MFGKIVTFRICEHGRQKGQCLDCKGSGICDHGRQKAFCKMCGGSAICAHDRNKYSCAKCKRIKR
jgi:hypothetical protein